MESTLDDMSQVFNNIEPEHLKTELWQWLLISKDEKPKPKSKEERQRIHILFQQLINLIATAHELIHIDRVSGVRQHEIGVKSIPNPAWSAKDHDDVYDNIALPRHVHLKSLSAKECVDLYGVIYSFFEWKSVTNWNRELKTWKDVTLCKDDFVDEHLLDRPLQCYTYLSKLIEVCQLLCKTEHFGEPHSPISFLFASDYMPSFCTAECLLSPVYYIELILEHVPRWHTNSQIDAWRHAATTDGKAWEKEDAITLIRLHDNIQCLIELAIILKSTPYISEDWIQTEKWSLVEKRKPPFEPFDRQYLTKKECENPFEVLHKLLPSSMGYYREMLREWLEAALDKEDDIYDQYFKFSDVKKVLEALHAITHMLWDPEKRAQMFKLKNKLDQQ